MSHPHDPTPIDPDLADYEQKSFAAELDAQREAELHPQPPAPQASREPVALDADLVDYERHSFAAELDAERAREAGETQEVAVATERGSGGEASGGGGAGQAGAAGVPASMGGGKHEEEAATLDPSAPAPELNPPGPARETDLDLHFGR